MLGIIIALLFGLAIALFATQNTAQSTINIATYIVSVPLYVLIIGSALAGLIVAWMISIVNGISSYLTIHGKDTKIKERNKTIAELNNRIHDLEIENIKLQEKTDQPEIIEKEEVPSTRPRTLRNMFSRA